ncbi:MAG: COQ9 family protein [Rhodospirillales bacterium]|nr:COQ9 family protein [Rhodospirillales bacterium]
MDSTDPRDAILFATLPHVAFDGWVDRTLKRGAEDAGFPPEARFRVFPGGALEMIEHWSDVSDRRMLETMDAGNTTAVRLRERISGAIRARIDCNSPYREAARRSLAFLAMPPNTVRAARMTWRTVDAIWYAAGDASADFSFYTKRATLVPVYGAAVLYWLDDESEDFAGTWAFVERRIDDIMRLPQRQARLRSMIPSPFRWLGRTPFGRRRPV